MMTSSTRLLFVINDPLFFLSHRLNLAHEGVQKGFEVHVAAPDSKGLHEIASMGFSTHAIPLHRWGSNPLRELRSVRALHSLYKSIAPDLIHHVTIKPVLYGTLAARLAGCHAVVNAIPGLGQVFAAQGALAQARRIAVQRMYRIALKHPRQKVLFQNPDDLEMFLSLGLVDRRATVLLNGAGVDTDIFFPTNEPTTPPVKVLFSGRLLRIKGIEEFLFAAKKLKAIHGSKVEFIVAGSPAEGNPGALPERIVLSHQKEGTVTYLGHHGDIAGLLQGVHIVCLPSHAGEGTPKALIEASSSGRPVVTTDSPGCRNIIRHDQNGLLVPPRDAEALANALETLILDSSLRFTFGEKGRSIVVDEGFGSSSVVAKTFAVYKELLSEKNLLFRGSHSSRA
jgi:glycosyltransferase involved in cell wall biosynthesis